MQELVIFKKIIIFGFLGPRFVDKFQDILINLLIHIEEKYLKAHNSDYEFTK